MSREQFAARLRSWREAEGITQSELSLRLQERGVSLSDSSISLVESGKRSPRLDELAAWVDVFGVTLGGALGIESTSTRLAERLRSERDRLRREVVELRGHAPHDYVLVETRLGERMRWSCRRCGVETVAPVDAYFDPCLTGEGVAP